MKHEIVVGNIGTVYSGSNDTEAINTFNAYASQSRNKIGRAATEPVTWFVEGQPHRKYSFGDAPKAQLLILNEDGTELMRADVSFGSEHKHYDITRFEDVYALRKLVEKAVRQDALLDGKEPVWVTI